MKITKRQLKRIIKEVINDSNFQFKVDPSEYIKKDMDVDQMHQMIDLLLDSEGINYVVDRRRNGYTYEFGYIDEDSDNPDPKSYQVFLALRAEMRNLGIPTLKDMSDKDRYLGRVYMHDSDTLDSNNNPVGDIRIRQSKR